MQWKGLYRGRKELSSQDIASGGASIVLLTKIIIYFIALAFATPAVAFGLVPHYFSISSPMRFHAMVHLKRKKIEMVK